MEQQSKQNLLNADTWIRIIYMVIFSMLVCIAYYVVCVVAVIQAGFVLITGSPKQNLAELGQITSKWIQQVNYFLTFNIDQKPFPFDEWPDLDQVESQASETKPTEPEVIEAEVVAESSDTDTPEKKG